MLQEIKSWLNGKVLFSMEAPSIKVALEAAVEAGTDLSYANLSDADIRPVRSGRTSRRHH
jgi:hypothetical protein